MMTDECDNINRRYLLNIGDDPSKVLEPIWGYAHEPLTSLTEACQPLHSLISRLESYVWVALENSKNPSDNLTEDESAAIYLYTMEWESSDQEPDGSLYKHLNRALKMSNRSSLHPWFRYLKLFLTALAKIPIAHPSIVWRGVRADCSQTYIPGTRVTWWPFSSCTTSLSVLESDLYLGNAGVRTLFSVEPLNGRTIRSHSRFTTEDEILLLPGTYLEVVSKLNPAPDLQIIHLRQIKPPFDLLEPPFEGSSFENPGHAPLFPSTLQPTGAIVKLEMVEKEKDDKRPWNKKKLIVIGSITLIVFVAVIILGSVFGTQKTRTNTNIHTSMTEPSVNLKTTTNTTMTWEKDRWDVRNEFNTENDSSSWTSNNMVLDAVQGLYMRLTRDSIGNWWCAEAKSQQVYSFGSFTFFLNASIDKLDPNVVLRILTRNGDEQTDGIVIEIGSRGQMNPGASNLWYTVYPNGRNETGSTEGTHMPTLSGTFTTHRLSWTASRVTVEAEYDHNYLMVPERRFHLYSTDSSWASFVPQTPAHVVISLCTYNGRAPTNNEQVEINVRRFFWNPI